MDGVTPSGARRGPERFLGFAFAAADLLTEIDASGRIVFAAGGFRERFGQDASAFHNAPVARLVAPEDAPALDLALSLLTARGRVVPMSVRLATPGREVMAVSGLFLAEHPGVMWLAWARPPLPFDAAMRPARAGADVARALETRVKAGAQGQLALLEIGAWQELAAGLRRELEDKISATVREVAGPAAETGALASGRFGAVGAATLDMAELQDRIGRVLRAAGVRAPVAAEVIPMGEADVTPIAALRAMRFALTTFARQGLGGLRAEGFGDGLRGFLTRAEGEAARTRAAIEAGRFRVMFQPVVSLADRQPHHFEALLRPYPRAGRDDADTQSFVTFAEAIGLAETLDEAVLDRVAAVIADAAYRVAVNVSGLSLQSGAFAERLIARLQRDSRLAAHLMLELTETAEIDDVPAAVQTVARLAACGVELCLDDFGAGQAAFRYLREFAVQYVKIDGSYVRGAAPGNRDGGFVAAMVDLARCVGAGVIAEMVETEAQAETVAGLGIEFGQGWLFGRPGALPGAR